MMSKNGATCLGNIFSETQKSDPWFCNFTELEFLINEITGKNADNYNYAWGSVIDALDKPTIIKFGNRRDGFKPISDVVRDHLNKCDIHQVYGSIE